MEKIQVFAAFFNKKWRKEKNKKRKNIYIGETVSLAISKFERETGVTVSSSQFYSFLCDEYLNIKEIKNPGTFRAGRTINLMDEYIPRKLSKFSSYSEDEEMDPFEEIEESDEDFGDIFERNFNKQVFVQVQCPYCMAKNTYSVKNMKDNEACKCCFAILDTRGAL